MRLRVALYLSVAYVAAIFTVAVATLALLYAWGPVAILLPAVAILLPAVSGGAARVVIALWPRPFERILHRLIGHPPEARFEGDLTAGCTIGPRACGAVWDVEEAP